MKIETNESGRREQFELGLRNKLKTKANTLVGIIG